MHRRSSDSTSRDVRYFDMERLKNTPNTDGLLYFFFLLSSAPRSLASLFAGFNVHITDPRLSSYAQILPSSTFRHRRTYPHSNNSPDRGPTQQTFLLAIPLTLLQCQYALVFVRDRAYLYVDIYNKTLTNYRYNRMPQKPPTPLAKQTAAQKSTQLLIKCHSSPKFHHQQFFQKRKPQITPMSYFVQNVPNPLWTKSKKKWNDTTFFAYKEKWQVNKLFSLIMRTLHKPHATFCLLKLFKSKTICNLYLQSFVCTSLRANQISNDQNITSLFV